MSTRMQANPSE